MDDPRPDNKTCTINSDKLSFACNICILNNQQLNDVKSQVTLTRHRHTQFQLIVSSPSKNDVKINDYQFVSNKVNDISNSSNSEDAFFPKLMITTTKNLSILLSLNNVADLIKFKKFISNSNFISRTEEFSAQQYFQFYSLLSQQQNMMQDYVRTGTYQQAMLQNSSLFKDKVVMDCGAGSAILSFFAIQAGAKKVYAVEASNIAKYAEKLVASSPFAGRIEVISGKLEEISIDEKVDILISEPMGYMLYNERMLESYVHAKKFLKGNALTDCLMFPSLGDTYCAPFSNEQLYLEQHQKASFWCVNSFYGINLTNLHKDATNEYFSQPVVDQLNTSSILCPAIRHRMDFRTANESDFKVIEIPFQFILTSTNMVHGFAFWFDVCFAGSAKGGKDIWLSTAPSEPLTHWYQVLCVLKNPLFGRTGETLFGKVHMEANSRQSYNVKIQAFIKETNTSSEQTYDLKNPFFRYTGMAPQTVPGNHEESPSNELWNGNTVGQGQNTIIRGKINGEKEMNGNLRHKYFIPSHVTNGQMDTTTYNDGLNIHGNR